MDRERQCGMVHCFSTLALITLEYVVLQQPQCPGYNPQHRIRTFGADTQVSEFYTTSQATVAGFEKPWSGTKIRDVGPEKPDFDARLCRLLTVALRNAFCLPETNFTHLRGKDNSITASPRWEDWRYSLLKHE